MPTPPRDTAGRRLCRTGATALALAWLLGSAPASAQPATPPEAASAPASEPAAAQPPEAAPVSSAGQRVYEQMRGRLVQVRTLLKTQDSQSSVGSAFLVSDQGHLITNYHVISQFALQPDRYRLVYAAADGSQGALQLLAFDVVHDLALVKPVQASGTGALSGRGAVSFLPAGQVPSRGARMFSLGNPLDVGFAVNEGAYNGLVERSFVPTVFFGGSLSPGMSGGPAVDESGRLVGVNVATRIGGEQVSLVVPAEFAQALLARGRDAAPITKPVYPELTRQLMGYETALADKFLAQSWREAGNAHYRIPVPQEQFMRCWGSGSRATDKGLQFERSDCQMDTQVFISDSLQLGNLSVRHEAYDGSKIGPLRFAQRHSTSFANEGFGIDNPAVTAPRCHERTVESGGLPMRAVICMSAYKKLPGLYRLGVLVATLDQSTAGVQGRFDASGVSFDNAMRLTQHYLDGFGWIKPKTASR
ncbi:MAG TPA: serine protease [Ideonella sp.]|nr:serine protease [Ideonella sp.]